MPKYIAIAAITLDGKIAKGPNHMSSWTSKEDKDFLHAMLDKCDVILVGNNTYKIAIKPLSKRNCIVLSRSTFAKASADVPSAGKLVSGSTKLQYCNPDKISLNQLIKKSKYHKIAILGGAQTYTFCLQNNLLDELYLTIEPLVFGQGIGLFNVSSLLPTEGPTKPWRSRMGEGAAMHRAVDEGPKKSKNYKFKLLSTKKINNQGSLLLHYKKI